MAIEDMIDRIMNEAKAENQSIILDARKEADRIKAGSRKELADQIKELDRALVRETTSIRNIYVSDGKRKARQALLSSKEELIWDAICAIRTGFKELRSDKLGSYLRPMMERSRKILGNDLLIYPVRKEDVDVLGTDPSIKGLLSENIEDDGPLSRFKGKDLLGGFIASTSDGQRIVDMSFHGLLERNEEKIREVIARTLFGDQ